MLATYAMIYLVPGVLFLLGIWLIISVLAEFGVGTAGRRTAFVVLATLLLSPSVAGSVITVVLVPNGLFLLAGDLPMLHQARLVTFAATSFAGTAVISAALAWLCIRRPREALPAEPRWARVGASLAVVGLMSGTYYIWLPNREIPDHVNWALLETAYGEDLDRLAVTYQQQASGDADIEEDPLRAKFGADPVYWNVHVSGFEATEPLFFQRAEHRSSSCSGQPGNRHALMRCTWDSGNFFDTKTLKYSRRGLTPGNQQYEIAIQFDYDQFLSRHPTAVEYNPGAETLRQQDQLLLGRWRAERETHIGEQGPRFETVSLSVGPRRKPGEYAVELDVKMISLDGSGKTVSCLKAQDRCKWSGNSSGTLRIRGSQIQIIYDAKHWFTDRLQLHSTDLVGVDPWGEKFRFQPVP